MVRILLRLSALLVFLLPCAAAAKSVEIDVDTSLAVELIHLACSHQPVDRDRFARSEVLAAQLKHHSRFGAQYSLDNYLKGLDAIARCEVPSPDPFRFESLVNKRQAMIDAVGFLAAHREELGRSAAAMILPYVPEAEAFHGSVVLAPASFSCGGFTSGKIFFIDIPCVAENISGEYDAIKKLIAHETYHAVQDGFMPSPGADLDKVKTIDAALNWLFNRLAAEGSASFVGDALTIQGDGKYATFSRDEAKRGFARLPATFMMFDYAVELLGYDRPHVAKRLDDLDQIVFGGRVGQPGYFMGQQMTAQIAQSFGASAVPCVLALPPANFVLAYDRAIKLGKPMPRSQPVGARTLAAARRLSGAGSAAKLDRCLKEVHQQP